MTRASDSGAPRAGGVAPSLGAWLTLAALAWWTSTTDPIALAAAAVCIGVTAMRARALGRTARVGTVVLLAAILVGFLAHRQIGAVLDDWDGYWNDRVGEIEVTLNEELDRRQAAGEQASDALAAAWDGTRDADAVDVAGLRERAGASALALYGPRGELLAWDGTHRGRVPEDVQRGLRRHAYRDLPLFGYLYVTSVAGDGSAAVAAYLLRAALPAGLRADARDLVQRFHRETGERIRITAEDPGIAEVVWYLQLEDDRRMFVVLERPDRIERATALRGRWTGRVAWMLGVAWLLLAIGTGRSVRGAVLATLGLGVLAGLLPFHQWTPLAAVFDVGGYALPGPVPLPLGRVALVTVAAFALVATLPPPRRTLHPLAVAAIGAALGPLVVAVLRAGATDATLAGARAGWIFYQLALAGGLSLVAGLLLARARGSGRAGAARIAALVVGGVLAVGLGVTTASTGRMPAWAPALWGIPLGLAALGVVASSDWRGPVTRWALAIALGSGLAVPAAWGHRFEARLAQGVQRLETLARADHPELEDALFRFGRLADSLHLAGALDVSILYDGWLRSGLAELGHPVSLQMHRSDGSRGEGLRVGVDGSGAPVLEDILRAGWTAGGIQLHEPNHPGARYVLTVVLSPDEMASVVAPSFPTRSGRSAMGPLLRGASEVGEEPLTVLPLVPGDRRHSPVPTLEPGPEAWQIEVQLDFPDAVPYHAHYRVDLPTVPLAVARASLLLVLDLGLLLALWLGGRALLPHENGREVRMPGLVISFRARVTLALFGFFALANALFGTVAYRTLDQASRRSAQVIAERVVEDAAGWYRTLSREIERLATQVGAELLEYRDGELWEGSVPELVELGLYEAWVPYEQHRLLEGQETEQDFTETSVGRWEYVTAYRRLPDGDVLAAQVPLQAGTTALQATDLVELLAFLVVLGGALSLGLAMLAGRTLTRPIHALVVASESVGSGDLALQLPGDRTDEFGAVFRAFNRMVERVRRARGQLVRTSERTQLIMDESAVGMVALDDRGTVTLVNPRAEELLGSRVDVGQGLPREGEVAEPLASWLDDFLASAADEATTDIQAGDRRLRVRVRRLVGFEGDRGAVVAVDDVTDELRAERVLAWGEMARQVAHEVKNPLTPIKLSIQHLRRAWDDERPDFEHILVRNADAMLAEIDRLASIAQSFSRFGAPGEAGAPLQGVSLGEVVGEVMALYASPQGGVRFEHAVGTDLPAVVTRAPELKEVLVNLLENARLAGGAGTVVTVEAEARDGSAVELRVVDNGDGIPEDVLPRVFEPQFSTRSTGTGLGLAIVQRLVHAWGGAVRVESRPGEGTRVCLTLRVWADGEKGEGGSSPEGRAS